MSDELYSDVVKFTSEQTHISITMLQRRFRIGYGRACSLLEEMEKASIIDDRMLRRFSAVVFAYAGIGMIEGIGLYLEKVWAEYLTLIITASFLPWEIFEVMHRLTWMRAGLLVLNVLVLLYLLKVVTERVRRRDSSRMP